MLTLQKQQYILEIIRNWLGLWSESLKYVTSSSDEEQRVIRKEDSLGRQAQISLSSLEVRCFSIQNLVVTFSLWFIQYLHLISFPFYVQLSF